MSSTNPLTGFLESVELRSIHPSRKALRSQVGSLEELIASIEEKGLLKPIVVRPVEKGFEVVAGNRRLEACRRLRMNRIPCHIVELDDREAFEVSLVENLQHETMNPIDEARAFKRYVDDYGYDGVSELARKIGKSQEYVSRRIQLLSLPKRVREEVMRRRITTSAAQELASLDDRDASEVVEIISEQHLSMREVRRIVKYRQTSQRRQGEPCSDLDAPNRPDSSERRTRRIDRALARAVASLKMDMYRLSDVIDDVEDEEDDEWMVRELLFQCRSSVNEQMENLLRFRKRFMRGAVALRGRSIRQSARVL